MNGPHQQTVEHCPMCGENRAVYLEGSGPPPADTVEVRMVVLCPRCLPYAVTELWLDRRDSQIFRYANMLELGTHPNFKEGM